MAPMNDLDLWRCSSKMAIAETRVDVCVRTLTKLKFPSFHPTPLQVSAEVSQFGGKQGDTVRNVCRCKQLKKTLPAEETFTQCYRAPTCWLFLTPNDLSYTNGKNYLKINVQKRLNCLSNAL